MGAECEATSSALPGRAQQHNVGNMISAPPYPNDPEKQTPVHSVRRTCRAADRVCKLNLYCGVAGVGSIRSDMHACASTAAATNAWDDSWTSVGKF